MERLPSYTAEVLPDYELSPTTSVASSSRPNSPLFPSRTSYHYRSERMELDLGPRKWGTRLPAYGKDGVVEGTVKVRTFKHVDRIVVSLIGKLSASHILNQVPTLSQSHTIVNKSIELWSSGNPSSSNVPQGVDFPFSFTLEANGTRPMPASTSVQLPRAQANVAYIVRVDMYRRGIHLHETLQTEILYIPRTTSHYCRPFIPESGNEKRPRITESEWHRADLRLERAKTSPKLIPTSQSELGSSRSDKDKTPPQLWFPQESRYPSGHSIPFMLSLPATLAQSSSKIESSIEVQLVRVTTVQTRAGVVQQVSIVSRGHIEPSSEHGPTTTMRGTIDTGKAEREFSWSFESIVSVSYEIRAILGTTTAGLVWKLTHGVELVTHEWHGEHAAHIPSLGSSAASRTGASIIHINF
ncbi:putative Asp domain protein [Rhizoctonia solani 123E]|uniref:Putative Asp domain protein n=1 Tax=Rhizoctonia solani 123E TaxID=1423351 RepID=A0A074S3S8_9AGAM|nr:putative Asp domain protein [Rhizoctonia solani 123E]